MAVHTSKTVEIIILTAAVISVSCTASKSFFNFIFDRYLQIYYCRCNKHSPKHIDNTYMSWKKLLSCLVLEWQPGSWPSIWKWIWSSYWGFGRHTCDRWEWDLWYTWSQMHSGNHHVHHQTHISRFVRMCTAYYICVYIIHFVFLQLSLLQETKRYWTLHSEYLL